MAKGWVLLKCPSSQQSSVLDSILDVVNQLCSILTLAWRASLKEPLAEVKQTIAGLDLDRERDYNERLTEGYDISLKLAAYALLTTIVNIVPYYPNEAVSVYLIQKVTVMLDWLLFADSVRFGASNNNNTTNNVIVDDVDYLPLLFSSLSPTSVLNIYGEMRHLYEISQSKPSSAVILAIEKFGVISLNKIIAAILTRVNWKRVLAHPDELASQIVVVVNGLKERLSK